MSKWLCEELARYHARRHQLPTVAPRLGMFVPETFERYGFRLLFGGVDDRDAAQAVLLALEHEPAGGSRRSTWWPRSPSSPRRCCTAWGRRKSVARRPRWSRSDRLR
jgi:hypothetical protein